MKIDIIAKNLLLDKTCDTCFFACKQIIKNTCMQWRHKDQTCFYCNEYSHGECHLFDEKINYNSSCESWRKVGGNK